MSNKKTKDYTWMQRALLIVFMDVLAVLVSYMLALFMRFDFIFSAIPRQYLEGYIWSMPYWVVSTVVVFYICRLYHSIWRLASVAEVKRILTAYVILMPIQIFGMLFMHLHMPRSYYFMGYIISLCLTTGIRFSYRLLRLYASRNRQEQPDIKERIMIIGAGEAGQMLIKELFNSRRLHSKVCCLIDDNPSKKGRMLEGVPIVGNRNDIMHQVEEYKITSIIFAIPAAKAKDKRDILNICKHTGCRLQILPGIYQLVKGEVSVSQLRDVEVSDLLGREQVKVNNEEILHAIHGKTVLVTGGGGSIGSELCRQIAKAGPKQLIIFDMYENNAYEIQQELMRSYPHGGLDLVTLIGSVRNTNRLNWVMNTYRPDIVFHAAAHKHVPLMEESPNEAIKNNVLGTYKTSVAACRAGVKKFVLISTDKAVNPTNIMGASKGSARW